MTAYQVQPGYRRMSVRRTVPIVGLCLLSAIGASFVTRIWTLSEMASSARPSSIDAAPVAPVVTKPTPAQPEVRVSFDPALGRDVYFLDGQRHGGTPNGGP